MTALLLSLCVAQASFDVQLFRPSPHGSALISVESGAINSQLSVRAQLYLDYAHQPLALFDSRGNRLSSLDHRLDMRVAGAIAFLERMSIALEIPATLFQGATLPSATTPGLKPAAFGDLRLSPKVNLLWDSKFHIDLAVLAFLTVPTATRSSFAGDGNVSVGGEIDLSKRYGPLHAAINYGIIWRASTAYYDLIIGPEMYARAGVGFDLGNISKAPIEFIAEMYGRTSLLQPFRGAAQSPLEGLFAARISLIDEVQLTVGAARGLLPGYGAPIARAFIGLTVIPFDAGSGNTPASGPSSNKVETRAAPKDFDGDGILDRDDDCKKEPEDKDGFEDDDGCPELDNDNDGFLDGVDKCPKQAEDKDGFEDGDGCPEIDNDRDGIRDAFDRCPNQPETINGNDDTDGCPDPGPSFVALSGNEIVVSQPIEFQGRTELLVPRCFPVLDQVAALLANHTNLQLRIEISADGIDTKLAQRRAEAIVDFMSRTVAKERMQPVSVTPRLDKRKIVLLVR